MEYFADLYADGNGWAIDWGFDVCTGTDFGAVDDDACVAGGAGEDFTEDVRVVGNACDDFGWEPERGVDVDPGADVGSFDDDACVAGSFGEDIAEDVGAVRNACDDFGWEPEWVVDFVGSAVGIFRKDPVKPGWAGAGDGNAVEDFGWADTGNFNAAFESGRVEAFDEYTDRSKRNADTYGYLSAATARKTADACGGGAASAGGGRAADTDIKTAWADCSDAGFFAAGDSTAGVTAGQAAGCTIE